MATKFQGKIGEFATNLTYNDNSLTVHLSSDELLEEFTFTIDQEKVSVNPIYALLFETPLKLYNILAFKINANQVQFSDKTGIIEFDMEINTGSETRSHRVRLHTTKDHYKKEDHVKKSFLKITSELDVVKQTLQAEWQASKLAHESSVIELKSQLQNALEENQRNRELINKFEAWVLDHEAKSLDKRSHFCVDTYDAEAEKFDRTGRNTYKKNKDDSAWHGLVGRALYKDEVNSYKVRPKNLIDNRCIFGIGSNDIRGKPNPYESKEFIGYYGNNGKIWTQGTCIETAGGALTNGDLVEVRTDLRAGKIVWFKNGAQIAEHAIPAEFKDKDLFEVILLMDIGAEVEFP